MNVLVIGAAGFVGGYLIDEFFRCGYDVTATKLSNEVIHSTHCKVVDLDILVENDIRDVVKKSRPDAIVHLAAQSSVALSWENPALTARVNIIGAVNLLEALNKLGYKNKVLLIGSGEEYGRVSESDNPIDENAPAHPANIYAATKTCQNMLGQIYSDAYELNIVMVRAFNHVGPGQSPTFVVSDFCKQVAEIEAGIREPVIYTGNLTAMRDFTDVRDVVRAYAALIKKGKKGSIYNVGSGKSIEISKILEMVVNASTADIKTAVDKSRFRPIDVPVIEADISKIKAETGWKPEIDLTVTIAETLDYWRRNIGGA